MRFERGELAGAERLLNESLDIRIELNDRWGIATAPGNPGMVACEAGDKRAAVSSLQKRLSLRLEIEDLNLVAFCLENLAAPAATGGEAVWAARLWGAAESLRTDIRAMPSVFAQPRLRKYANSARLTLERSGFTRELAKGHKMKLEDGVELAFLSGP